MKKFLFCDIDDGSNLKGVQIVLGTEFKSRYEKKIGYGASVVVSGKLAKAPKGNLEISADEFKLIGECPLEDGYPFVPRQNHSPEYIRNYIHMRTDISSIRSTMRVRHHATRIFHQYFNDNGFICIHTPVITSNSCEGAGEVSNWNIMIRFYLYYFNFNLTVAVFNKTNQRSFIKNDETTKTTR